MFTWKHVNFPHLSYQSTCVRYSNILACAKCNNSLDFILENDNQQKVNYQQGKFHLDSFVFNFDHHVWLCGVLTINIEHFLFPGKRLGS